MTADDATPGDPHRPAFAGIVLLLRQLAQQLLEHGNAAESRGIVDGLEALQVKTRGNLDEGEQQFLKDILFELRMAVVKGPAASAGDEEPSDAEPDPEQTAE